MLTNQQKNEARELIRIINRTISSPIDYTRYFPIFKRDLLRSDLYTRQIRNNSHLDALISNKVLSGVDSLKFRRDALMDVKRYLESVI